MIERRATSRAGSLAALALLLALALAAPLGAQGGDEIRVVRRADRRALILLLATKEVKDYQQPVDASRFVLVDRQDKSVVPLERESDISEEGCRRGGYARTRICLALAAGAPSLIDSHTYLLLLDSIPLKSASGPAFVAANTSLDILPVGARVQPIGRPPAKTIEVSYDLDALGDTTLAIELAVNGKALPIPARSNTRAGQPLCYNPTSLSFICIFDPALGLHDGDRISAKFTRTSPTDAPLPTVAIKTLAYKNANTTSVDKPTVCSLCIQGGLSQTTSSKTATLQLLWHNTPLALRGTHEFAGGTHYEGSLSPYLDLLVSTDATTKGYIDPGVQYSGFVHWNENNHFLRLLAVYLTPRAELDKKATVMNFVPLDLVLQPGLGALTSFEIFLRGKVQLWPDVGIEQGWTVKGRSVARVESNDPSRLKGGASLIARWLGPDKPAGFCRTFGCAEFDVSANWQHYRLNDTPVLQTRSNYDYGTLQATYKFTEHVGLSFCFNDGYPPPLFVFQRVETLGLAIVY
jgi:hypothetical protein